MGLTMSQDNKLLLKLERIQPTDWLELIQQCNLNVPLDKLDLFHGQIIGAAQFYLVFQGLDKSHIESRNKGKAELKALKKSLDKTNEQLTALGFDSLRLMQNTKEAKDHVVLLPSVRREIVKLLDMIDTVLEANSHKKGLKGNYSRNSMIKFLADTFYEFGGVGKITRNPTSREYSGALVRFISGVFEILQIKTSTGMDSLLRELASKLAERP